MTNAFPGLTEVKLGGHYDENKQSEKEKAVLILLFHLETGSSLLYGLLEHVLGTRHGKTGFVAILTLLVIELWQRIGKWLVVLHAIT